MLSLIRRGLSACPPIHARPPRGPSYPIRPLPVHLGGSFNVQGHAASKSHGIISIANPHPLTPLGSYRFENRVGGIQGSTYPTVLLTPLESTLPRRLPFHTRISHPKLFRMNTFKRVHSEQLKVPLESILLKNRGGGGQLWLTRSVNQKTNKGFLSQVTPVLGANAGPSTVGRPVPNRTDASTLPHIYI